MCEIVHQQVATVKGALRQTTHPQKAHIFSILNQREIFRLDSENYVGYQSIPLAYAAD